jgi:hypothetical protein
VRSTLLAVGVALAISAVGSVVFTVALHDSAASGLVTFVMFGGLAGLAAGFLAWEVASNRVCPRCAREQAAAAPVCAACGYDLRARPRFVCSEGHRPAFEPGLCDCGRRLVPLAPAPIGTHLLRTVWVAVGFFVAVVLVGLVLTLAGGS